jgi:uncharacterized membrane protein YbjE (DUF340 family)
MTRVLIMVLASLSAGIAAGFLLRRRGPLLRALDRGTMLAVYVLLFVLGLSVGANREVVTHLHELGTQAFVISILSVAGSLACVYLVWVLWFTERHARAPSSIQNPKSKIQNHEETAGGHMGPPLQFL